VAAALAAAGCETVWIGAESGSQKILDAMDKGDTVRDIYTAATRLRAAGIRVCFFLQFGYPGETWDDIQLTLKMVRECLPDDIGISVSYPLPGTPFYERVRAQLGDKQNWIDSNDLALLYQGPYPQEFYRVLHGRVHHEFRLRQALSGRRAPRDLGRRVRALARLPYHLAGMVRSERRLRAIVARAS
jgi:anaerobic magnesium-protoporphyrin IX monomethyl ester cyclase